MDVREIDGAILIGYSATVASPIATNNLPPFSLQRYSLLPKHGLILLTLLVHEIDGSQYIAFVSLDDVAVHYHLVQ